MKKTFLLCLILISSINLWSQHIYEIDSIISVSIPGDDVKIDSLQNNKIIIKFHSKTGNSEFLAQKELFENDTIDLYDSNLPHDVKSLKKYYESLAKKYVKNSKFKLESENLIEKNSLKGYHLKLTDNNNNGVYEIEYFLLNKHIYLFSYKNIIESDLTEIDKYFNSIQINSSGNISQFHGKSSIEKSAYNLGYSFGYKLGYMVKNHSSAIMITAGLVFISIIGLIVYFRKRK